MLEFVNVTNHKLESTVQRKLSTNSTNRKADWWFKKYTHVEEMRNILNRYFNEHSERSIKVNNLLKCKMLHWMCSKL